MECTDFNQRTDFAGRSLPVYQIVDDFGDLLGLHGVRNYAEGCYKSAWAYFANGD